MNLLFMFLIFIICMVVSLILKLSMLIPLLIGFGLFTLAAMRKGFSLKSVLSYARESLKESFIVVGILLLIGCLTGMWRLSGTVAYFVSLGVSVIPSEVFLLAAFLLSSAMSFALGTSFGVTATAGVILISIANAGGVNPTLAAGAILSGVYVGDRGSPAASSGNLVAVLTHTDMRENVRKMLKSSIVPFLVCCLLYGLLSLRSPLRHIDTEVLDKLGQEFRLHWTCILPAILMILLPFCGMKVKLSMAVSLCVSAAVALTVQGSGAPACIKAALIGYVPQDVSLKEMLSGGGMVSMLEVCGILIVSCSYGSIFKHTGLLENVHTAVEKLGKTVGRFPAMIVLAYGLVMLFCNQTISAIMQSNLAERLYSDSEAERNAKMLDMENSVILLSGTVPWCIACSVPLSMLGASVKAVPLAFYLWLVPLWWLIRRKRII